jgi:hypothetical protein
MRLILTLLLLVVLSVPAFAQEEAKQDASQQERLQLAEKINEVNPVARQIEASLLRVAAEWNLSEKEKFKREMIAAMDIKAIEKTSAKAMADTFTKEELNVLLEYYSHPETAKIVEKMPLFQGMIQPGISREIDRALMKLRTGYEAQFKNAPNGSATP